MKRILIAFFFLLSVGKSFAQVDSSKVIVSVPLQARDWEYLYDYLRGDAYDATADSLKATYRRAAPLVTDVLSIKMELGAIVSLHYILRNEPQGSFSWGRYDAAVRALNVPYVNNILTLLDNATSQGNVDRRTYNRKKLLGIRP
jgi:hypothetical protein